METFSLELIFTPFAQSKTSLSPIDSQNLSFETLNKTGSFIIPPSSLTIRIYLHCPTSIFEIFLGVSN